MVGIKNGKTTVFAFICALLLSISAHLSEAKAQYLGTESATFGLNTQRVFTSQDLWSYPITLLEVSADSVSPALPIKAKIAVISVYQGPQYGGSSTGPLVSQETTSMTTMNGFDGNLNAWASYLCFSKGGSGSWASELYEVDVQSRRAARLLICSVPLSGLETQFGLLVYNPERQTEMVIPMTIG